MPPRQGILITRARIKPNEKDHLQDDLREIDADPGLFDGLQRTHFLRWTIVRVASDEWLVLSSNFDGGLKGHLAEIAELIRGLPHHIYGHCQGAPDQEADVESWVKYLRSVTLRPDLFFNGALYRSISQIEDDRTLWDGIQREIDGHEVEPPGPWGEEVGVDPPKVWPLPGWLKPNWREREVRTEVQQLVDADDDLRELTTRRCHLPPRSGLLLLGRVLLWGVAVPLAAIGSVIRIVVWATPQLAAWPVTSWLVAIAHGADWSWVVAALLGSALLLAVVMILGRPLRFGAALFRGSLVVLGAITLALATQLGSPAIGLDLTWSFQLVRLATAAYVVGFLVFGGMVVLIASVLLRVVMSIEEKEAAPPGRPPVGDGRQRVERVVYGGQQILLRRRRDLRVDDNVVRREGRFVQNEVTHVAPVKRGWIRLVVLSNVLFAINLLSHHYFQFMLHLGGITSIHFGYWTILDPGPGRQKFLLFMTNYDGSFDQYLADFAKRGTHLGLNAIWSNCEGYPQTRNAFQGGAVDNVEGFIDFGRVHQIETQVWHSAYRDLTVTQINRNSIVRKGLKGRMKPARTRHWIQLLASYGTRLT